MTAIKCKCGFLGSTFLEPPACPHCGNKDVEVLFKDDLRVIFSAVDEFLTDFGNWAKKMTNEVVELKKRVEVLEAK